MTLFTFSSVVGSPRSTSRLNIAVNYAIMWVQHHMTFLKRMIVWSWSRGQLFVSMCFKNRLVLFLVIDFLPFLLLAIIPIPSSFVSIWIHLYFILFLTFRSGSSIHSLEENNPIFFFLIYGSTMRERTEVSVSISGSWRWSVSRWISHQSFSIRIVYLKSNMLCSVKIHQWELRMRSVFNCVGVEDEVSIHLWELRMRSVFTYESRVEDEVSIHLWELRMRSVFTYESWGWGQYSSVGVEDEVSIHLWELRMRSVFICESWGWGQYSPVRVEDEVSI